MLNDLFDRIDELQKLIRDGNDDEDLRGLVWLGNEILVERFMHRSHVAPLGVYDALLRIRTSGGLDVPARLRFTGNDGADSLVPARAAADFLATARWLRDRAAELEARKTKLEAAIRSEIKAAGRRVRIRLVRIDERSVEANYPQSGTDLYHDVVMTMLDEELRIDTFSMRACDPEEFAAYLRETVVPEQEALAARLRRRPNRRIAARAPLAEAFGPH